MFSEHSDKIDKKNKILTPWKKIIHSVAIVINFSLTHWTADVSADFDAFAAFSHLPLTCERLVICKLPRLFASSQCIFTLCFVLAIPPRRRDTIASAGSSSALSFFNLVLLSKNIYTLKNLFEEFV